MKIKELIISFFLLIGSLTSCVHGQDSFKVYYQEELKYGRLALIRDEKQPCNEENKGSKLLLSVEYVTNREVVDCKIISLSGNNCNVFDDVDLNEKSNVGNGLKHGNYYYNNFLFYPFLNVDLNNEVNEEIDRIEITSIQMSIDGNIVTFNCHLIFDIFESMFQAPFYEAESLWGPNTNSYGIEDTFTFLGNDNWEYKSIELFSGKEDSLEAGYYIFEDFFPVEINDFVQIDNRIQCSFNVYNKFLIETITTTVSYFYYKVIFENENNQEVELISTNFEMYTATFFKELTEKQLSNYIIFK